MTKRQAETLIEAIAKDPDLKAKLAAILSTGTGAVNGRFAEILQEIRELRKDFQESMKLMERRLDESMKLMERRLDESMKLLDRRLDKSMQRMDRRLDESMNFGLLRVQGIVGGYRQRAGAALEEVIAGLLRVVLGPVGLRPQDVRVRQEWTDPHGRHEIDLVVGDGAEYVLEITWDLRDLREKDLAAISEKMDCAIAHWKLARARKVLVAVDKDPGLRAECDRLGLILV